MNDLFYDKRISLVLYKLNREDAKGLGKFISDPDIKDSKEVKVGTVWTRVNLNYTPIITISCEDSGMKPDITLSFEAVPGHTVVKCDITIVGLQLNTTDIRNVALMKIVAGYGSDNICELNVNVFSAWCESPNPDGVTKIQGIATGGALGMFFGSRSYQLQFRSQSITVDALLEALLDNDYCIKIPDFKRDVKESFLDREVQLSNGKIMRLGDFSFQISENYVNASSGYQLVQWLGRELFRWGKGIGIYIYVIIYNDTVKIKCSGTVDKGAEGENYVQISGVNNAAYTGGLVTFTAPWHPKVTPGSLVHLPLAFYSMENMYRGINRNTYNKPSSMDLYRVIDMKVNFSSVSNTNTMNITALQYSSSINPWDTDVLNKMVNDNKDNVETLSEKVKLEFDRNYSVVTSIVIGYEEPSNSKLNKFWGKLTPSVIPNIKARIINLFDVKKDENDVFTFNGADWKKLYSNFAGIMITNIVHISESDTEGAYVPVLKPSEKRKIIELGNTGDVKLTELNTTRLRNTSLLALNPECLWVILPIYAYYASKKSGSSLYKAMNMTNNPGELSLNMVSNDISKMDKTTRHYKELTSQLTGEVPITTKTYQLGGKSFTSMAVSIPNIFKVDIADRVPVSDGGNTTWIDEFKGFENVIKLVLEEPNIKLTTSEVNELQLWYYVLLKGGHLE